MATIKVKNSVSSGSDPTGLTFGELAVNITDKKIYIGNAVGSTITLHDQNGLVTSVNGATGAITNVAKTDTAQTFTQLQEFSAGLSAANGITFNSNLLLPSSKIGVFRSVAPSYGLEVNSTSGACTRMIYNDSSNSSPTNYTDFNISTGGDLTIDPSGSDVTIDGNLTLNDWYIQRCQFRDYSEAGHSNTINAKTSTLAIDLSTQANVQSFTLNNNITSLTISNLPVGPSTLDVVSITLIVLYNGNTYSVTWPASFVWENNSPPTLTYTNGKYDIFNITTINGGTSWFATIVGQNF